MIITNNIITSNSSDFVAVFNANKQMYDVFYKGKLIISKYKFSEVKSYLN
jgi:hypothetical protein